MSDAEGALALADRYWERLLELDPMLGTLTGDERYDDRLPDPSEDGRAKRLAAHREALIDVGEIDRGALDDDLRGTMDVLEAIARRLVSEIESRMDFLGAASHLWGPGQLLAELGSMQRVDTAERLDRFADRLSAVPAFLDAVAGVMQEGVAAGVTSPRVVAERAVAQVERLLEIPPGGSPALMRVESEADRERLVPVIRDAVNPAFERYLRALREYLPHATETIGLSALPGGDALYASQILAWTTLPLAAKEVHQLGVERLEAIQEERAELASRLGFASAADAIAAHDGSGRNRAASRDGLLRMAREQVERGWDAASAFFVRVPSANCDVRLVEEFREADMPFAFYQPPTADGSRAGVYYVNAYDLVERALHHLAATTYHEANPGHHFQITVEQETTHWPRLRRFGGFFAGSAFCEGWGLYCERLAEEMGLYLDEWERLGMLDAQGHRAARLVTDTGVHALGWTREAAVAKLEESGVPHVDAVIEIDRYIALPGQALSYMIGMIEIEKARVAGEARGGSSFSLREFHDRLLGFGQLPLPALRRELGSTSSDAR